MHHSDEGPRADRSRPPDSGCRLGLESLPGFRRVRGTPALSAALLKAALDQDRLASKEPQILIDKDRVPA